MNSEFFKQISIAISKDRINAYSRDGAGELIAMSRYLWNIAVCESLYSPLQMAEIALRNAANRAFSEIYGPQWYDNAPLQPLNQNQIGQAKAKITRMGKSVTPSRMVEELHFGFWTSFFNRANSKTPMAAKLLKTGFRHCPKRLRNIKLQRSRWNLIRTLRNSVFHHERIIHWKDLSNRHECLIETLGWLSPELREMAQKLDRFKDVYSENIHPWSEKIKNHWPKEEKADE